MELDRKDAEAQDLCHGMTERLKLLHEERRILSAELREMSAWRPSSSSSSPQQRFVAVDHALAAMATAGIVGVFAGAVAARFLAARNKIRTKYGGEIDDDTANAGGRLDSPKMN